MQYTVWFNKLNSISIITSQDLNPVLLPAWDWGQNYARFHNNFLWTSQVSFNSTDKMATIFPDNLNFHFYIKLLFNVFILQF